MYGRDRERALLRELLDAAVEGHGGLVLISGEAGIGKTTLVDDLVGYAEDCGCLVLSGGCYDLTTTPPYGPWVEILRRYHPGDNQPPIPESITSEAGLTSISSQHELFDIALGFFGDVAKQQPMVLVFEDLHWADESTLDLLRTVSRELDYQPILILGTYRSDELTRRDALYLLIPSLIREARATRIDLQRLTEYDLHIWLDGYALATEDQQRLVEYLMHHGDGVPFFVAELLRALLDDGTLYGTGECWKFTAEVSRSVPPLLQQVVERRLMQLPDNYREALQIAAVIGNQIDNDLWPTLAHMNDAERSKTLHEAISIQILSESADGQQLEFRHALLREVLYQELLPPIRRQLHRQIGERLSERPNPNPDRVADHFLRAHDQRAADWLIRAGQRANRIYAWAESEDRFEQALALLEGLPQERQKYGWLLASLSPVGFGFDAVRGLAYLAQAEQVADELNDRALRAFVLRQRGINRGIVGEDGLDDLRLGSSLMRQLSPEERAIIPTHLQPIFDGEQGLMVYWLAAYGQFDEALAEADAFLAREDAELIPNGILQTLCGCVVAHAARGEVDAAYQAIQSQFPRSQHRDNPRGLTLMVEILELMRLVLPYDTENLVRRHELVEILRDAIGDFERSRFPRWWRSILAYLAYLEGRWSEALRIAEDAGDGAMLPHSIENVVLGRIAWARGETDLAWSQIASALPGGAPSLRSSMFDETNDLLQLAAELAIEQRDFESGKAWIKAHRDWLDVGKRVCGRAEQELLQAKYAAATDKTERARQHAQAALEFASKPRQPLALIVAHRFLSLLDVNEERFDHAAEHLTTSRQLAERCEFPFEQAQTLLVMADLAAKSDDFDEARRLLTQVRAICEPLEAKPTLARANQIEGTLPKPRADDDKYPAGLTAREVEVLRVVADGKTDSEAADELFISPRTVSQHLRSVYNKLGVNSRVEATRFAVEEGLVSRRSDD